MLRTLGIVAALQLLAFAPAWSCTGQVGNAIFQDNFADDTGGWDEAPPGAVVQPPVFAIALSAQIGAAAALNGTFSATDADYCMDFVQPPAIAANNQLYVGIFFWTTDVNNGMAAVVGSNDTVTLYKVSAGTWTPAFTVQNAPGFNAAGGVNSLRVTALSGLITVYLNGTQIKSVRAQEPVNPALSFGIYAYDDTTVANVPVIQIKDFDVTAGK